MWFGRKKDVCIVAYKYSDCVIMSVTGSAVLSYDETTYITSF